MDELNKAALVYLDNNATTRVAPEVVEAMLPFLTEQWGNPSSAYLFGHQLAQPLDEARTRLARLLNAEPRELVFTSCGTESNNTAIHSALMTRPDKRHVVTTAVEHSATVKFCNFLHKRGYEVTFLPVTPEDAVQVPGKLKMDVNRLGVDFLSLSGHKLHAPKGIGLLYVKRQTKFQPYIIGGGQERGRRGGTENVAQIVAFGRAAELATARLEEENARVRALRDKLEAGILATIEGSARNGAAEPRLPNTTNIAFEGVEAEGILMLLDQAGICASSGSACTTGSLDPSPVLLAMGCSAARARSSVRFSLGIYNTEADVDHTLRHLPPIIEKLRANAPLAV